MSPELQGVVIGGAIALLTAALGHAFAWGQQRANRSFDIRRAVYLEAAAVLANSLQFFDDVANLHIEDSQLAAKIHPVSMTMFKVHVVGTPTTMAALSAANHFLTVAAGDLSRKRAELRARAERTSQTEDWAEDPEVGRLHRELLEAALQASLTYQRYLAEMNVSVRRELGLKLDGTEYRATNARAEEGIVKAIENLRVEKPS